MGYLSLYGHVGVSFAVMSLLSRPSLLGENSWRLTAREPFRARNLKPPRSAQRGVLKMRISGRGG